MTDKTDGGPAKSLDFATYLQALALFTLATSKTAEAHDLEACLSRVLGFPETDDAYMGHLSDAIWLRDRYGISNFHAALRLQGFTLPPEAFAARKGGAS